MAQIQESGRGGKRSLNYDVNLVPFIDLLSVCICFLLMAAVWLQVGSVRVMQSMGEVAPEPPTESFELSVKLVAANQVTLELKKGRKSSGAVQVTGTDKDDFMGKLDVEVGAMQTRIKGDDPASTAVINAVTIFPNKDVSYGGMVTVMDVLRKREIVNLAVMPVT